MKAIRFLIIIITIAILGFFLYYRFVPQETVLEEEKISLPRQEIPIQKTPEKNALEIKSPAFENNGFIPQKYTCDGKDINPPLIISNVPTEAKSLILIVEAPEAPGKTFLHWIVWNIPPETSEIKEGSLPKEAVEGKNDFGKKGYGGPCPPSGKHRYVFRLYAITKKLELPEDISKEEMEKVIRGAILAKSELIGLYSRQ